jgi:hypothetical protein
VGSAGRTRTRAQGAVDDLADVVDDLVRGAESGLARSGRAVRGAIDERLPATQDDLRELKAELRAISRRLESIEERLPAGRKTGARGRSGSGKRSGGGRGGRS